MAKRNEKLKKERAAKNAAKRAAMARPGSKSKYAEKKVQQAGGSFRSTSPFRREAEGPEVATIVAAVL